MLPEHRPLGNCGDTVVGSVSVASRWPASPPPTRPHDIADRGLVERKPLRAAKAFLVQNLGNGRLVVVVQELRDALFDGLRRLRSDNTITSIPRTV